MLKATAATNNICADLRVGRDVQKGHPRCKWIHGYTAVVVNEEREHNREGDLE